MYAVTFSFNPDWDKLGESIRDFSEQVRRMAMAFLERHPALRLADELPAGRAQDELRKLGTAYKGKRKVRKAILRAMRHARHDHPEDFKRACEVVLLAQPKELEELRAGIAA